MARFGAIALLLTWAGCAEDRVLQPQGSDDGGGGGGGDDAGSVPHVDAGPSGAGSEHCDMTGVWIVAQVTFSTALGATQKSVNWFYHDITQTGDTYIIEKSLNCGFRVTGTTTVTLRDETLAALAINESSSAGRQGTFSLNGDGTTCTFDLDRVYNLRAANKAMFLTDHWVLGDPDKALSTFPPLPANAGAGIEDWDNDGHEGFTLVAGTLGDRYVAQRDWNEHAGTVPIDADQFGGDGVIVVTWDGQEAVSQETPPLLRTQSTPDNPGHAWWARVNGALDVVESGPNPELETCKNVQRLALETFPNP